MNNIDLYIEELESVKVEIKDAIIAKGVTPTGGLSSYAAAISEIDGATIETDDLGVLINENGSYYYTPEGDGFTSVAVTVDVIPPPVETETLSVELTENGTYNYTPTKDGYSSVEVIVDVASSGGGGVDLTTIGFSADVNNAYNTHMTDGLAYAQNIATEYDGVTKISGNSKYKDDTNLVYFPVVNNKFTDARYMFQNCNNLEMVNIKFRTGPIDGGYTQMDYCFDGCTNIKSIKINSSLADPKCGFRNCYNLTELSVGGNVFHNGDFNDYCKLTSCFENCVNLEAFPNVYVNGWREVHLGKMFKNCKKMKVAPTILYGSYYYWEHNMPEMFMGCESLLQMPSMQYAYKAADWTSAFEGCASMVDTAKYYSIDPSSQTYGDIKLNRCFYGCKSLTVAPVVSSSGRDTYTNYMYASCTSLTTPFEWYNNVVSAEYMYYNCTALTKMTTSSIDFGKCANVKNMFAGCTALTNVGTYSSATFTNLGKVADLTGTQTMFSSCNALSATALKTIINGLFDRATAGYSVLTLYLGSTNLAKLTDADIAIATNKGWILS